MIFRIGIDREDTLEDFCTPFIAYCQSHSINLTRENWNDYDLNKVLGISNILEIFAAFYNSPYLHKIVPVDGAQDAVRYLKAKKHDLVVVTSRPKEISDSVADQFDRNFSHCFSAFYFSKHASYTDGGFASQVTKAQICLERGIDIVIDDGLKYVKEIASNKELASKGIKVILFGNYGWNQCPDSELNELGIVRAEDWKKAVEIIDEISQGR